MSQSKTKIALVGNSLSSGGAEKVQARLSFLFEEKGFEVHHILVSDAVDYDHAGKVFNLGIHKNATNGLINKWKRLKLLKKYLKEQSFNMIVDFRVKRNFLQEFIIAHWVYRNPFIVMVHSYHTKFYFPGPLPWAKRLYTKAFGIVAVSKEIALKTQSLYGYQKVTTIYNPIDLKAVEELSKMQIHISKPYILAVGRLENQIKQFDHLLEAFAGSRAISRGVRLIILGEGKDRENLESLAHSLGISGNVEFRSFLKNPFPLYANAYFTVLTSKFEGFPNTLVESLAVGSPVISYDCKSGPSEIVSHGQNGLLVEAGNIQAMTEAINLFLENSGLYQKCRTNAQKSVQDLDSKIIVERWLEYMKLD